MRQTFTHLMHAGLVSLMSLPAGMVSTVAYAQSATSYLNQPITLVERIST